MFLLFLRFTGSGNARISRPDAGRWFIAGVERRKYKNSREGIDFPEEWIKA
jgi:hypothetical protein